MQYVKRINNQGIARGNTGNYTNVVYLEPPTGKGVVTVALIHTIIADVKFLINVWTAGKGPRNV